VRLLSSFIIAAAISQNAAAATDVVPLEFINGIPFMNISVGATQARVMFDSGGRLGISLPAATIEQSGSVKVLDEKQRFQDLQGKTYEMPRIMAEKVVVGSTMLAPVKGQVHTQWGGAPEGPEAELTKARAGGAIGLAAFANFPLMFDYKQRTMSILDAEEAARLGLPEWRTLDLEYDGKGPVLTLVVEGKRLKFVLDTGAQVVVVKQGAACDTNQACELRDVSGTLNFSTKVYRLKLDSAPFDGILGAPFFRAHRVVFDLKAGKLHIAPLQH
jgi:hypothetical protein